MRTGKLMHKDGGRHKHTDWRFLFVWLVQTLAAAVFFLISLGAFVWCGWDLLFQLGWIPSPESVPALQKLELRIQGYKICHYIRMAADFFRTLCTNNYVFSVILLLISFLILVEAWALLLNRFAAAREIRRYGI